MKKTTVIIPNYNGMQYIANCLTALRKQTQQDFSVLVVDNGSKDGSRELIEADYPEVALLRFSENMGFCKAVNAGIMQSETPFVILLNNDTIVKEGFVEALEYAIKSSETIFSVASKMLVMQQPDRIDGAGDYYCALGWAYAGGKGKIESNYREPCEVFSACAGAAIYRRAIFDKIGYFDENHFAYLEDMDVGYRARIYGFKNLFEPKAEVLHAGSGFSGSRYNAFKTKLSSKNSVYLIYKNMPMLQLILNFPLLLLGYLIKTLFFMKKGLGKTYLMGVGKGISFCFTKSAREHKVRFCKEHLAAYLRIQWELWRNMLRFLIEI